MTKRADKYRFYPTIEQEKLLAQTFGCVRFVYNHFTFHPSIIDFSVNLRGAGHGMRGEMHIDSSSLFLALIDSLIKSLACLPAIFACSLSPVLLITLR